MAYAMLPLSSLIGLRGWLSHAALWIGLDVYTSYYF